MADLRPPGQVMRLARLGAAHQTRLSFMRVLLRGMRRGGWQVDRPLWRIDQRGVGVAVYRVWGAGQCYSLVAFAHDLPDGLRSDRVIAEAWDATFTLVDGDVSTADLDRLGANVPLQEAGRISDRELVLARANRSTRVWDHVVGRLSGGRQPDPGLLADVGYLMRTTAVYGSGKFGAADHAVLAGRPVMDGPFRAEMLAVWLIRAFTLDLVEHVARAQGGALACALEPGLRRLLGIGNSTGLGMAPFLVNHPLLLNAWIAARETALARVRALPSALPADWSTLMALLGRSETLVAGWSTAHPLQRDRIAGLARDLERVNAHLGVCRLTGARPWDRLWRWGEATLSPEGQEMLLSLMLEPHGDLVDDLAQAMSADEVTPFRIDGLMTLDRLSQLLRAHCGWALEPDYTRPEACARFWYVSEAKLEPRLGDRHAEPGAELEQPLDIGRMASALAADMARAEAACSVADFLAAHPDHRRIVRRVQMAPSAPYGEIRDNLIAADLMPIDMLRCKLAFFGATRFDPRSDRWVRITMFQGAPGPDDLHMLPEDDWVFPGQSMVSA